MEPERTGQSSAGEASSSAGGTALGRGRAAARFGARDMKPFPGAKGHQLMDLTNAEESMSSAGGGRRKGFAVAHKDVFLGTN